MCLSTPKHNGKSVSDSDYPFGIFKLLLICIDKWSEEGFIVKLRTMDLCLCGAILDLKAFCFEAIPDIMIELIVYGSVPQSRQT
jgi:hypothetical protein